MKPAPFRHFSPTTVDECVALLAEHGDDAKVLAGGHSLVPLMNLRLAAPEVIIDLNGVEELVRVREDDGHLVIGAMTRQRELASSEAVRAACPLLAAPARRRPATDPTRVGPVAGDHPQDDRQRRPAEGRQVGHG